MNLIVRSFLGITNVGAPHSERFTFWVLQFWLIVQPWAYKQQLRVEVEQLVKIGALQKVNRSEWGVPTFVIPKKDWTIRFISNFWELNKQIKRKPYPIPKIQDLLLKLEGFTYATSLDLNMGFYHIELTPNL